MSSRYVFGRRLFAAVVMAAICVVSPFAAAQTGGERATALRSDIALDESRLVDMNTALQQRIEFFDEFSLRTADLTSRAKAIEAVFEKFPLLFQ